MRDTPSPSLSRSARSTAAIAGSSKILLVVFSSLFKLVHSLPILHEVLDHNDYADVRGEKSLTPEEFYLNLVTSIFLVLAGGVFAGLTLGLMGQDEVYLKVIATSGEPNEQKHARKVLQLIGRGKHWVLVTLLLSNVITNESLPIVLDNCLGGGWPAVVASTVSIVIFGEIIPQSICVRYGLQVGALFAPFVLVLMYIMYPVAYPCAMLLDHILGEDHGTVYKKSGLKTLVTLHKTMGVERLNQDEVTIISAVLDLKEKPVSSIMTPMDRVYTMSADTILDEKTVEEIFNAGFSRIPIHLPNEPNNFIGMLLVRVLISYDPEDALPVAAFPLATLPETALDTSCLNILNYFQEGKSHMIVVSEHPGEPVGARGVLTLEDVIEELIGEEIVDESDVYIDINKKIKRKQPGPLSKRNLTSYLHTLYQRSAQNSKRNSLDSSYQPDLRERLSQPQINNVIQTTPKDNVKPKNPAQNPLETNKKFVTIKKPVDQNTLDNVTKAVSPVPFGSSSTTPAPAATLQPSQDAYGAVYSTEKGALVEAQRRSFEGERYSHTHEDKRDLPHYHVPNIGSRTASSSSVKKNPARFLLPEERETDVSEIHEESHGRQEHEHGDHHDNHEEDGIKHYHGSPNHSLVTPVGIPTTETSSAAGLAIPQSQESRSYRTGGIIESVVNVQGVHKTIIENVSDEELQYEQILHERQLARKNFSSDDIDNAIQDGDEESEGLLNNGRRHSSGTNGNGRRMSLWEKIRGASQSPSEH